MSWSRRAAASTIPDVAVVCVGKNSGRGLIPNRVDIDQRPPIVAAKSRIGDWEADTIIGANQKGVVMSHVERTSEDAIVKMATTGKLEWKGLVDAIAADLIRLQARQLLGGLFSGLFGGSGGGLFGSLFGGGGAGESGVLSEVYHQGGPVGRGHAEVRPVPAALFAA